MKDDLFFSVETKNGLEEDVASYTCYRPESNGDRSESIRQRTGDDQEPVSFMVIDNSNLIYIFLYIKRIAKKKRT